MRRHLLAVSLFCLLVSGSSTAGIYKCVGPDGSLSFQEMPCGAGERATEIKGEARVVEPSATADSNRDSEAKALRARIPEGGGAAVVAAPSDWEVEIVQPTPDMPPTFNMTSRDPADPMKLLITFLPNKTGLKLSDEEFVAAAERMFERFVADSIEQKIELEAIDTTLGTGLFAVFNDRKYLEGAARPPAEFITMTTGLIWHSRVIVNYTILTNGEDSPSRAMAQNVVGGFSVFGDLPAAQ